jgi:tyrosyl-tRNA synthetase
MQTPDDEVGAQLLTFSLQPVEQIRSVVAEHADAPHLRFAQRALADEMTALVHGAPAAVAAAEAADLLFSGDPATASEEAFATLAAEIPSSTMPAADLDDVVAVFTRTALATSNGDARRALAQRSFYANGVQLDENSLLSDLELVHGRYLLLRKGKKSHHLVEISS